MKKRLLSLLLAFVLVLGMLPVSAFASELDNAPVSEQTEIIEPVIEAIDEPAEELKEPIVEETTESIVEETTESVVEETTEPVVEELALKVTDEAVASAEEKYTEPTEHQHTDENGDKKCDACGENTNHTPTLKEGVTDVTATVQTGIPYQLDDLVDGKTFEDADEDSLSYFYRKSSNGGETWGEWTPIGVKMDHGGVTKSLNNDTQGIYLYEFKANDGFGDSADRWYLTLKVLDVVPANIKFYLSKDQNYNESTHPEYPVLELYRTAGIDEDMFDYIGWYEKDRKKVYVYDPQDYTIIDGKTDYVVIDDVKYELFDYEKITFTNSAFNDSDETATASGTLVDGYNMFYASITTGRYSTRAYGKNPATGVYDVYLGGQSMELPREKDIYGNGGDDIYLRLVTVHTTSKKVDDSYFTADDYYVEMIMPITGSMIHAGDPFVSGNYTKYPFMSWASGNGSLYNYYAYPYDTVNYIFAQAINQTTSAAKTVDTKNITIGTAIPLYITIPESGEFGLYFQYNNFNTKEVDPAGEAVINGDGTKTILYRVTKNNGNYTWRLTDPSGKYVTKSGWLKNVTAETEKVITFSDFTNKTSHDFSNLGTTVDTRDEADIQVFLSGSGFKRVQEKTRIRAYRMWQLINTDSANIMIEPDFNIQVLQGNPNDITPVNGGNAVNNWIDVLPTTTDIVAVNYDALEVYSNNDNYGGLGGFFPATNPERTNVFIITNETAGTAAAHVAFNGSKETDRGTEWDYNYDTWFYLDSDTKPVLDFTVTGTGNVDVSYATVITDSNLKSTLSGWTSVQADANGSYQADLLKFRNAGTLGGTVIIKMADSTGTSYLLVRVAEMKAIITNVTVPGETPMPGNTIKVTFENLYRSVNKISGVFNPTKYNLMYTLNGEELAAALAQYQQMDQVSYTIAIPMDLEFPEGADRVDYVLTNGYVDGTMYSAASPFDTMYYMTDTGMGTNFSAVGTAYVLSKMADIPITITKPVLYDLKLEAVADNAVVEGMTFTLTGPNGESFTPDENGIYQDLPVGEYTYTLAKVGYVGQSGTVRLAIADVENVVDGILTKTFTVLKAAENAWDGTTVAEPKAENDIYQIGTGAELAWFAQAVNDGNNTISAVLTADIDLACYNWTPIGNSTVKYSGTFDGQNHKVYHFCITDNAAATGVGYGLFGYANNATFRNLYVDGAITLTNSASVSNGYTGGLVGANTGTLLVENVHTNVDITIDRVKGNWSRVGGIIGSSNTATITNCSNSGNIVGYQYVGGIAAYNSKGTISNCYNTGDISGYQYVAGIAATCPPGYVHNCYNTGAITATNNYAAGIVSNNTGVSEVTNCFNIGKITFGGTSSYAGSVVGNSNNATGINANLYYLEGTYSVGIGTNKNTVDAVAVSAETLASAEFVATMNTGLEVAAYKEGVKHPVLTWQPDRKSFSVTIPTGEDCIVIGAATAKEGAEYTFTVEPAVGYKVGKSFAVKVNGEPVIADVEGKYSVYNVTSDLTITVEGMEKIVWEPVSVYLSMSHDDAYLTGKESDTVMAFMQIQVPYFDLALYGMENFYFSSESYGDDGDGEPGSALDAGTAASAYGKITLLHMFIYATEVYYCGLNPEDAGKGYLYNERLLGTDTMTITGSVGSIYFNNLWGMDENLNYYHNYEYPLASEGWGSTADQILLKEGDIVTVGHFSNWLFHTDPGSVFNYIKAGDDVITTEAIRGKSVKLSVIRAGADGNGKYSTAHTPVTSQPEVYCIAADQLEEGIVSNWTYLGTADENGEFLLDTGKLATGQYIIAIAGQYGLSEGLTDAIVSAPGGILLTVKACGHNWTDATCTEPKTCTECGETEGKALGHGETESRNAKKATYTKTGYTGDTYCADCGTKLKSGKSIAAKGLPKPNVKVSNNTKGDPVLKWTDSDEAVRYDVYRATSKKGNYKKIGSTTTGSYTDTKAAVGTYYYKVKAIASKSKYNSADSTVDKAYSKCANATVTVSVSTATGKPTIKWKNIAGAKKYTVYRATSKNGTYKTLKTTTATSYTDTSAKAGKTYYYKIKVIASKGSAYNSGYSTVKRAKCILAKPVIKAALSNSKPKISWKKVSGATKYEVYRSTKSGSGYTKLKTVSGTSFRDTTAKKGVTYYYKVVAVNSKTTSAFSAYAKIKSK